MIQKYKRLVVGACSILAFMGANEAQSCPTYYENAEVKECTQEVIKTVAALNNKVVPTCFNYRVEAMQDLSTLLNSRADNNCTDEFVVAEGFHGE